MEYRKEIIEGDKTIYETYEGTPEEILEVSRSLNAPRELVANFTLDADKVVNGVLEKLKEDEETVIDENELIDYINDNITGLLGDTKPIIKKVLDLEEKFLKLKGIIEN